MQREDKLPHAMGSHAAPVYAVDDGVRLIMSPTAVLLSAVCKFCVRTVVVARNLLLISLLRAATGEIWDGKALEPRIDSPP
jgi:hypothetical protein